MTIGGAANTLTYEGGIGADTIKVGGAVISSTILETVLLQLKVVLTRSPLLVQHLVHSSGNDSTLLANWPGLSEHR